MTTSHKMRGVSLALPEAGRLCGCGRECRPHTFFCGDECRFWAKVQKGPGCWLWTGATFGGNHGHGSPYGQFSMDRDGKRTQIGAHVFAYELAHGRQPEGSFTLHHCDVTLCVRNDADSHIYQGDQLQNMRDAARRGRLHVPRPKRHKLTSADIYAIRERVTAGELRYRVAADYGIAKGYVTKIMDGSARPYDAPLLVPAATEQAS